MVFVAAGVVGIYLLLLIILLFAWRQIPFTTINHSEAKASVIVPFRNEEANLTRLLQAIKAQTHSSFEVIFVNDHSTDDSLNLLTHLMEDCKLFPSKIISLKESQGKKSAITEGIAQSSGDIIVTTDADCWFGENWLKAMMTAFEKPKIQMVTGPVVLEGFSFFQKLQRVEFGAVLASSAALIGLGKPTMANGANLAYRRKVFSEVEGFTGIEQTPSGDDELLLMKITKRYPEGVVFAKQKEAMMHTAALNHWSSFIQQRKRWASKWKVGARWSTVISALFIYLVQMAFLALLVFCAFGEVSIALFAGIGLTKLVLEGLVIRNYFYDLKQDFSIFHFFCLQTFYPFYVLYVGLASNFGRFQWKNRSFKI